MSLSDLLLENVHQVDQFIVCLAFRRTCRTSRKLLLHRCAKGQVMATLCRALCRSTSQKPPANQPALDKDAPIVVFSLTSVTRAITHGPRGSHWKPTLCNLFGVCKPKKWRSLRRRLIAV